MTNPEDDPSFIMSETLVYQIISSLRTEIEQLKAERQGWQDLFTKNSKAILDEIETRRAELADLLPLLDADGITISNLTRENERLNKIFDELHAENDQLRIGLKAALDAIDWMFAAQQPLRDPWFTHRDTLIASARHALEQTQPHD